MQVPESKAHFDEELPNFALIKCSTHLPFEVLAQISIFTVLHDNVNGVFFHERIIILDTVLAIDLAHYGGFKDTLPFLSGVHFPCINNFHHIKFFIHLSSYLINHSEGSLAKFLHFFEVFLF